MLLGQQCGRRQQGHLAPAGHGHERGAQCDLGFAKTHVAADQAVHRSRRNHVLNDGVNRGALVGGFFEAEVVGEHLVVLRRRAPARRLCAWLFPIGRCPGGAAAPRRRSPPCSGQSVATGSPARRAPPCRRIRGAGTPSARVSRRGFCRPCPG